MIETTAINLKNPSGLMITWDMLRRCNLDCSYCESTRHNNYSPYPSLEELKETFDFIKHYTDLYKDKRVYKDHSNIDFTGGEPTANPNFWPLIDYIKSVGGFKLGLTTNGTWGPQFTSKILDNFIHVTISYHTEASPKLKLRSWKNIIELYKAGMSVQANIMLHCDHFDEAVEICENLRSNGITKINPVPIGDGNMERKGWFIDSEGKNRRTSHEYTKEQQDWFFKFMNLDRSAEQNQEGTNIGRACCGGRCTTGKVNGEWTEVKLVKNWFKDWHCTVNWFFMHIDQHTGNVFHHQTCQATFNGKGPIGNIKQSQQILDNLKEFLNKDKLPAIVCPNQRCGCGMCVPKAQSFEDFKQLWKEVTTAELE